MNYVHSHKRRHIVYSKRVEVTVLLQRERNGHGDLVILASHFALYAKNSGELLKSENIQPS